MRNGSSSVTRGSKRCAIMADPQRYRIVERAVYELLAPSAQDAMDQFLAMGSVERDRCFVEVTDRALLDAHGRPQAVIEKEG